MLLYEIVALLYTILW